MSAFCLFLFHPPWYEIGCYSKNLVPRNECTHAFLKGLLFYVFNWISLYLIAIKFVCLCFLESKMCMFSASVWEGKTHKKQSMVRFVPLFYFCDLDKWKLSNDRFDDGKYLLKRGVNSLVVVKMSDLAILKWPLKQRNLVLARNGVIVTSNFEISYLS